MKQNLTWRVQRLALRDKHAQAAWRIMCQRPEKTVIVTLGAEGQWRGEDIHFDVPTITVDAIDTVGAGDTFCGFLAASLSEGKSLEEALKIACAAGALACTKEGAQPAIPIRNDVMNALMG